MQPYEVFRIISLVVAWGIPTILVLGVAAFIILAPALAFGGAARRLYEVVLGRMTRKTQMLRKEVPNGAI